jgi:hypothetical protein
MRGQMGHRVAWLVRYRRHSENLPRQRNEYA